MQAIMKKLREHEYDGPLRPDHGLMIQWETGTPDYGLYDRAMGLMYLQGLWEGIKKANVQELKQYLHSTDVLSSPVHVFEKCYSPI